MSEKNEDRVVVAIATEEEIEASRELTVHQRLREYLFEKIADVTRDEVELCDALWRNISERTGLPPSIKYVLNGRTGNITMPRDAAERLGLAIIATAEVNAAENLE